MKKTFNNLILFSFYIILTFFLSNCGTEEELPTESIIISTNLTSIKKGESIIFSSVSNITGDVTQNSTFYVNGQVINGNIFTATEDHENNEAYAVYNNITSNTVQFKITPDVISSFTTKVLLEDYTGTWCGYCPRMATITKYLTEYSDRIIPIAIHSEGNPQDPWTYEFSKQMQSASNYNANGLPKGKINRIHDFNQFPNQAPCPNDPNLYAEQMKSYLDKTSPLGLAIDSKLEGGNLNITVKVGFTTNSVSDARLVVNLIEDGLVYNQVNYYAGRTGWTCDPSYNYISMPSPIPNFPQEHVLLKSFTDIFGDVIPQNEINVGSIYTKNFNVPLPSNVSNPNNLTLVAFVLGNGNEIKSRAVINAQKAKVGVNQDFD